MNEQNNNINNNDVNNFNLLDSTQTFNFANGEINSGNSQDNLHGMNHYGMQDNSTGLFNGSQFTNSMDGQATINNNAMPVNNFTTNVNDVLADAKFDSSVNNSVSNEFAQSTPTFFGYNANPEIVGVKNEEPAPVTFGNVPVTEMVEVPVIDTAFSGVDVSPVNSKFTSSNTIEVPAFDPFNSMAEPAHSLVQEPQPVEPVVQKVQQVPQYNVENPDLQVQQNSLLFSLGETQVDNNVQSTDLKPINIDSSAGEIDDGMKSNQPLSLMALSGETIDESQKPKDVLENNKYFQNTPMHDNRLNVDEVVVAPVVANDVLSEPTRDLNIKELVRAFIGVKYQKIAMSPFSFWGGFFGSLYFFYRKMFVHGFVLVAINFIISIISSYNGIIGLGLLLAEFIILGLMTNSLYLSFAEGEVRKVALQNPKMSQYELQRICEARGGTGLLIALLLTIAMNVVSNGVLRIFIGDPFDDLINNDGTQILNADRTASLEEVIDYVLPSEFVRTDSNNVPYIIEEEMTKRGQTITYTSCGFNIYLVGGHDTSEDLVRYMADTDKRYNKVSTYKTINNEVWDTYEFKANNVTQIYRARMFDGHIVLVTFAIHEDATEGMCEAHLESIMNSIKEK